MDPYLALLAYRTSPLKNGYSPSELLMCRKLRSTLPIHPSLLSQKVPNVEELKQKEEYHRQQLKVNFDSYHGSRLLSPLHTGDTVWVTDHRSTGVVVKEVAPRSYEIAVQGGTMRRNRRHLVRYPGNDVQDLTPQPEGPSDNGALQSEVSHDTPEKLDVTIQPEAPVHEEQESEDTSMERDVEQEVSDTLSERNVDQESGVVRTRSGRISRPPDRY